MIIIMVHGTTVLHTRLNSDSHSSVPLRGPSAWKYLHVTIFDVLSDYSVKGVCYLTWIMSQKGGWGGGGRLLPSLVVPTVSDCPRKRT